MCPKPEKDTRPSLYHEEDICLWADDTWCYACDLDQYHYMSDDYERIAIDTPRWKSFIETHD